MTDEDESTRLSETRIRTRRDVDRLERREPGDRFWRSLALIGSVGWPIVLLATGGALLGRYLDLRWGTGIRLTLMLLTVGTTIGTLIAFRTVRKGGR
jgi:predicted F0F1-ATPase subunit